MPQTEPVTVLVINDVGEEIKLVTLSFRRFFAGCRVDAVYSLDEALQWAPRAPWHLLLVDESLLAQHRTPILPELRRMASSAAIVLQTDRSDATVAVHALQAGADFLLYKKSPAFLTELMLYTKDALEKRDLRLTLERTQERHGRLVDTLGDVLYELDAEGRFIYLSPSITALLGYAPEELTGAPYSTVIPADQWEQARFRFNDRRTGHRAARRVEVDLAPKSAEEGRAAVRVRAELSAKGLYDPQRHFLGTLGLLRDISGHREQEEIIHRLKRQLQETDRLVEMARRVSTLAKHLQDPLAAVLAQSQQLFSAIQEIKLDDQVQSLLHHVTEAVRQGEALAHAAVEAGVTSGTLNDLLDGVLATTHPPLVSTDTVARRYASNLPPFTGNLDVTSRLFRTLLAHALRYVAAMRSRRQLRISTAAIGPSGARLETSPRLLSTIEPVEVEIRIEETAVLATDQGALPEEHADLFEAYGLVHQLGGRLDFVAPVNGLLAITVWLPLVPPQDLRVPAEPPASTQSPQAPSPLETTSAAPLADMAAGSFIRPVSSLPDRRQAARASVQLPARITAGNTTREGMVTNLSLGGAGITVGGSLPAIENQPVYVILKTAAGMLELQGVAQSRGTTGLSNNPESVSTLLAFRFALDSAIEQAVLSSLMEEARARTLSVTLEALLSLPEDFIALPGPSSPPVPASAQGEQRETLRVRVAMPTRIDTASLESTAQRPLGLVINISRGGACLQVKQAPGTVNDVLSLHFSSTGSLGPPRTHEPEAPEAILTAEIVWMAPDATAPSELRPAPTEPAQRIGIRFVRSTAFEEREINRVVAQHIGSSLDLENIAGRSSIVSARRECRNARQQVIAITDDHARHQISPTTPVVIVVPGFGKMQRDYLTLSYFLAANRLRVLRYDHTDHVGQSDGDVLQTTLRSMQVDFQTVMDFVRTTWPTASITVVAEDLGARVALKVMAQAASRGLLLLVDPVLDLQATLTASYRRDVLTDHRQGLRRGVVNLMGLNVNLDQFLADALVGEYADLSSSASDLAALAELPIVLTTRTAGDYISSPLEASLGAMGQAPLVIPLSTEISAQPDLYDERHTATFHTILKKIVGPLSADARSVEQQAPLPDIARQQILEDERLRIGHHVSQATREALWIAHLAQLAHLSTIHDYWAIREHLYRELLPLEPGMTIADVGCGHGDLARVLLTNQVYRLAHSSGPSGPPIHYVGIEQSGDTLTIAERALDRFIHEIASTFSSPYPLTNLVDSQWVRLDWGGDPPFPSRAPFTRIVFHLSLAYCPSPLMSLRHALAALDEEGTILITCLQPHSDFSALCRRHLQATAQDEFGPSGQVLLHYLGRVREAIRHGLLHRYEREELARLLINVGAVPLRIVPILDGQLLLAVARKGNSVG
jgi:PAS domain S-box-containing protein